MIKYTLSICFALITYSTNWAQYAAILKQDYTVLDSVRGAVLFKKEKNIAGEKTVFWLQWIDVRHIKIEQIALKSSNTTPTVGLYWQHETLSKSPYFKMITYRNIVSLSNNNYKNDCWGVMNAAFFEQYDDSTQLAFPIKINGDFVTAGSSPNGPQAKPKLSYYKNTTLKAFVWDDSTAAIQDYNVKTGYPLSDEKIKNAVVSYDYKDHPAKAIYDDPANRYHVLGVINNQIFMLTVNKTSLETAAKELRKIGVRSDIMTIDGGLSVFIHNAKVGTLEIPNGPKQRLPHYLMFLKKP
jgi:hypothetical protein